MHVRQVRGAGQVHVPHPAGRAGRGLVGVHRRGGLQQLPDSVHEPAARDQGGGLTADAGHPARGDPGAGHLAQQHRRPAHGNVVPAGQVRGLRASLRPEAGPRPHERRQRALGHRPAARALLRLRHVLRHHRRRRRPDVGDLVTALRQHLHTTQVLPALPARRRREPEPGIRIIGEPHRRPGIARLLARPPFPPLPQRPVPALFLIRTV